MLQLRRNHEKKLQENTTRIRYSDKALKEEGFQVVEKNQGPMCTREKLSTQNTLMGIYMGRRDGKIKQN